MSKSILPSKVKTKIYKTGQTRGADDDVIYQNRVSRSSTVLIPYDDFDMCKSAPTRKGVYENGYIVLIKPEDYFNSKTKACLKKKKLVLGENLLVFYETRSQWNNYPPLAGWTAASSRKTPLKGQYVARIPATTAEGEGKIIEGYSTTAMKGAGIRVYEYADSDIINKCKLQLEYLFWSCYDIESFITAEGLSLSDVKQHILELTGSLKAQNLLDTARLMANRIIDKDGYTICPFCLKRMSASSFCTKIQQAEGRAVPDLTVTEASLFHIKELRTGEFNHQPYNLGWGHHHCNVIVKDSGIEPTLHWLKHVLERNGLIK